MLECFFPVCFHFMVNSRFLCADIMLAYLYNWHAGDVLRSGADIHEVAV